MSAAVAVDEASAVDLAYLTDRVAMHAGQPQIYGTQLCRDRHGRLTPYRIADPDHVDQRRAALPLLVSLTRAGCHANSMMLTCRWKRCATTARARAR